MFGGHVAHIMTISSIWKYIGLLGILFLGGQKTLCQTPSNKPPPNAMQAFYPTIRLGLPEDQVEKAIDSSWLKTDQRICESYPFKDLLPNDKQNISVWRSKDVQSGGRPRLLFMVYSDKAKNALADAFYFSGGTLEPIVDGPYNKALKSFKEGDAVREIYRKLGKRPCEYLLRENGRPKVRFKYWGYPGRTWFIEADAADGIVTYIGDGTL
jgi:hypothetical protein